MTKETFVKGITIIEDTFSRTLNRAIAWEILKDIEDSTFMGAVRMMVTELKSVFPNDNMVAIVRDYATEWSKKAMQAEANRQSLPDPNWQPSLPPKEWEELKRKIGLS